MAGIRQLIIEGCSGKLEDNKKNKMPRNYALVSAEVKPVGEKSEVKVGELHSDPLPLT